MDIKQRMDDTRFPIECGGYIGGKTFASIFHGDHEKCSKRMKRNLPGSRFIFFFSQGVRMPDLTMPIVPE